MSTPLTREEIALAIYAGDIRRNMERANEWRGAQKIRAVIEEDMIAAFDLAEIWEHVRDKKQP